MEAHGDLPPPLPTGHPSTPGTGPHPEHPATAWERLMAKLRIAREVLERTRKRSNLTPDEKAAIDQLLGPSNGKGPVSLDVGACPLAFLKALLDESRLTPNQRAVVAMQ